jgi:hypothetical protein
VSTGWQNALAAYRPVDVAFKFKAVGTGDFVVIFFPDEGSAPLLPRTELMIKIKKNNSCLANALLLEEMSLFLKILLTILIHSLY